MKTEFKGTKGKFEIIKHNWSDTSLVCGNKTIATLSIYDEATEENQEELEFEVSANFKLLSKAPEMLEMLDKLLMHDPCHYSDKWHELTTGVKKLIKEATGINPL